MLKNGPKLLSPTPYPSASPPFYDQLISAPFDRLRVRVDSHAEPVEA